MESSLMASKLVVPMNQGQGETSYARNSSMQNADQKRLKPLIEAAIADTCTSITTLSPGKIVVADLGCSSGPNALALVSTGVEAIQNHCLELQQPIPEVCVLLNDLPYNDFNTVLKDLVMLRESNNKAIVVTGVAPGSFYERLFTSGSLHLVCSSSSLHWLSKAPEDLIMNQIPAYDIDDHARLKMHHIVFEAYAQQFRKDFTLFLQLRAKELTPGGRMVISLVGRYSDVTFSHTWEHVVQILSVMVSEGAIDKANFDSFHVPLYGPSKEELTQIILDDGSFSIGEMRVHDPGCGPDRTLTVQTGSFVNITRALFEPVIVQHFGEVMDEFVSILERPSSVDGRLQDDLINIKARPTLAISLKKA